MIRFRTHDPRLLRAALACFGLFAACLWAFLALNGCATGSPVRRDAFALSFTKGTTGSSNGTAIRWPSPLIVWRLPYEILSAGQFAVREDRIGFGYRYTLHPVTRRLPDGSWEMQGLANERPDAERLTPQNYVGVSFPITKS
jgi:hypothetical protein